MDQFIDSMNLVPEGCVLCKGHLLFDFHFFFNREEDYLDPESTLNPQYQHHFNCLASQAMDSDKPVPSPPMHILVSNNQKFLIACNNSCCIQDILMPPKEFQSVQENLSKKLMKEFPLQKLSKDKKKKDALAK